MKNKFKHMGNNTVIYLVDRKNIIRETLIDKKNFDLVNSYNGTFFAAYIKKANKWYCRISLYRGIKNKRPTYKVEYLHRIILNIKNNKIRIDHKNHNGLNNLESNLRISNAITNSTHRIKINSNNTSGYRNVTWINGFWRIQLQVDNKNHLFREKFNDINLANLFAKQMRLKYYGKFSGD